MSHTKEKVEIKEFARRVERLCDFLIDKSKKDGSEDIKVVQDLKDDAADLQFDESSDSDELEGLYEYMKGVTSS